MRKATFIVLLGAGIILSLAGCQKGPESSKTANLVQFKATSAAPSTRATYTKDAVVNNVQRIDWEAGDRVLVWSDQALNQLSPATKKYTYEAQTITTDGAKSIAKAYDDNSQGLTWTEGVSTFQFSACYPANGYTVNASDADGNPTSLSAAIPASQPITFTEGYGLPEMDLYMLANPVSVAAKTLVDLQFEPYFTAFELNVSSTDEIKIKSVTLKSEERTNGANTFGPSVVSGSFTAAMSLADANPAWAVTVPAVTTANVQAVATFSPAVELKKASASDTKTNEVRFVVFAAPKDITSLTFDFELENAAGNPEHRFASLSYAKAEGGHAIGDPVTFAGRKKHKITNLTLAPINKEVELILKVMPWEDETGTVIYGTEAIANAVALEYASGAGKTSGGARRQNNWFLEAYSGTGTDANPIVAYFSVFAPYETSGETVTSKWEITVTGDIDKMDVNVTSPTVGVTKTTADGKIVITGPTGTRVEFKVSRTAAVDASNQIQLNFGVIMSDGRRFSINSEVTRLNALTISGKVGPEQ